MVICFLFGLSFHSNFIGFALFARMSILHRSPNISPIAIVFTSLISIQSSSKYLM